MYADVFSESEKESARLALRLIEVAHRVGFLDLDPQGVEESQSTLSLSLQYASVRYVSYSIQSMFP
jgi:hypothetical protein